MHWPPAAQLNLGSDIHSALHHRTIVVVSVKTVAVGGLPANLSLWAIERCSHSCH